MNLTIEKRAALCKLVFSKEETEVKKLVPVSAISTSITGASEEALEYVPCIYYLASSGKT